MELRDEQLVSFATIGFFTFSLIHNLANQFTQLQFTVEEARQYLPSKTHKQLDQTTQYLSSVLRDSQAMLGRSAPIPVWFDLESAIAEALELSRFDWFINKIQVNTTLESAQVVGNRVAFLQIMLNLFKNSIEATADAETKRIDIRLTKTEHEVRLTVSDSGRGLTEMEFRRFPTQPVERIHGLGILYIEQQMQSCFHGSFSLENNPDGKGCLATLIFPVSPPSKGGKVASKRKAK